jgi:DNA-binding Xre family transcriptional regulator
MFEKILKEKNITIDDLAKQTGISRATLFNAKKDGFSTVTYGKITEICNVLDCLPHNLEPLFSQKETELEEQERMIAYSFVELPDFTGNEKKYIADMLNGSIYNINILPQQYLQMQTLDSNQYDGLGEKWEINEIALAAKLRNLTAHQAYTLIKVIRDWWNKPDAERELDNIF